MGHRVLVYVLVVLALASVSLARTWYITPDGTGDSPTIQAGIDSAAIAGDEVVLADGTFTGDGNRDIEYLGKRVTVRSESGDPDLCIIDCEGTPVEPHRGFYIHQGEGRNSVLSGVTVTGGVADYGGGAIECRSDPTIVGCVLEGNLGPFGGAVYCQDGNPLFQDCVFHANVGEHGGAIVFVDTDFSAVEGCVFWENTGGYAIHCIVSSLTISGCTFCGNEGGIGADENADPIIESSIIYGTTRLKAIDRLVESEWVPTLVCCDIWGNDQGDWVGFIADELGVNGNISACPSFCHGGMGDFHLCSESPCAPGNHPDSVDCGLIGAWGVECVCGPSGTELSTWGGVKSIYR